jgi:hypothetical protein
MTGPGTRVRPHPGATPPLPPQRSLHGGRPGGASAPRTSLRPQEPQPPAQATPPVECEAICAHHRPLRPSWAKLLGRVFGIDMEHCPNRGGDLKIIAAILKQPVIERIQTHLGLQARAPPWGASLWPGPALSHLQRPTHARRVPPTALFGVPREGKKGVRNSYPHISLTDSCGVSSS